MNQTTLNPQKLRTGTRKPRAATPAERAKADLQDGWKRVRALYRLERKTLKALLRSKRNTHYTTADLVELEEAWEALKRDHQRELISREAMYRLQRALDRLTQRERHREIRTANQRLRAELAAYRHPKPAAEAVPLSPAA